MARMVNAPILKSLQLCAQRLPIQFGAEQHEWIPVKNSSYPARPQFLFVLSPNPATSELVAELFALAGHCAVPVQTSTAITLVWRTPPDLILVDKEFSASDRMRLTSEISNRAEIASIPMIEFSTGSIRVDDQVIELNGHRIPSRTTRPSARLCAKRA